MALASKGWVNRRLEETGGPAHPRRLEQVGVNNYPWTKVNFGYKINPDGDNAAEIAIYIGYVNGLDSDNGWDAIQQNLKITISGTQSVCIRYVNATLHWDLVVIDGSFAEVNEAGRSDATYTYKTLYTFTESSGVTTLARAHNNQNQYMGPSNLYLGADLFRFITAVRMNGGTLEYKYREFRLCQGVICVLGNESDWT